MKITCPVCVEVRGCVEVRVRACVEVRVRVCVEVRVRVCVEVGVRVCVEVRVCVVRDISPARKAPSEGARARTGAPWNQHCGHRHPGQQICVYMMFAFALID